MLRDLGALRGADVVVTAKMDGENTTLYRDVLHARSLDSRHHPSRDWIKARWGAVRWLIPEGFRICGENLYAVHSIRYTSLPSYFLVFSVWDQRNVCLSWDETVRWAERIAMPTVPVLYRGPWNDRHVRDTAERAVAEGHEGIVVRPAGEFPFTAFASHVAKYVRPGHVQTPPDWPRKWLRTREANGLRAS